MLLNQRGFTFTANNIAYNYFQKVYKGNLSKILNNIARREHTLSKYVG